MNSEKPQTINEALKLERPDGKKKNKIIEFFKAHKPLTLVFVLVILVVIFFVSSVISQTYTVNEHMRYTSFFLNNPASVETAYDIEEAERVLAENKLGILFKRKKFEEIKKENEAFVNSVIDDLSAEIAALEKVDKIESYERFCELKEEIAHIENHEGKGFSERVENYGDFETYKKDFWELVETYKAECDRCSGRGTFSCSYCGGSGVKVVTWYSEGDWGDISYSSYDCKRCSGGRVNCASCEDGYVVRFDH